MTKALTKALTKAQKEYINPIHTLLGMGMLMAGNVLVVHKVILDFLDGDFPRALLLEQLLYWTPRAVSANGWIARSDVAFTKELCLTRFGVRAARQALEKLGYIEVQNRRSKFYGGAPVLHYRIRTEYLQTAFMAWAKNSAAHIEQEEPWACADVEPELPMTPMRKQTQVAMERGYVINGEMKARVEKALNVLPNWKHKSSQQWLIWLNAAEHEDGCTIEKFADWWKSQDWRGKQGQPPTLEQVRYLWPQVVNEGHAENLPDGV